MSLEVLHTRQLHTHTVHSQSAHTAVHVVTLYRDTIHTLHTTHTHTHTHAHTHYTLPLAQCTHSPHYRPFVHHMFTAYNCVDLWHPLPSHGRTHTPIKKGGIGPVNIPLVADVTKQIARAYGVLNEETGVALRCAFHTSTPPTHPRLLFLPLWAQP